MKKHSIFSLLLLLISASLFLSSCNPEDQYLSKLFPKDSRQWAIQELKKNKDKIVDKDAVCEKLLKLDKTHEAGMAIVAAGEIGCQKQIPRIGEIADECFKTVNVRNLKTLESIAIALGQMKDPSAIPILAKYFTIDTPEQLASGLKVKPESVAKRAAIEALAKMPLQAKSLLPQIIKVFQSKKEDFGTKYTTAGLLGNFGDPSAVKVLVPSLFYEEQGFSLFSQARKSLIKLGKYAENELIKAYKGENPEVNKLLDAQKLKAKKRFCPMYIGKPEIEKKGECPNDGKYKTTLASINAVKKIKTSIVLADIRSAKAVDMLIAELEKQLASKEKQPFLSEHIAVQLAKMGDKKATPTLIKMVDKSFVLREVKKKKKLSKDEKKQAKLAKRGQEISIRMKGAEALGILGDFSAIPSLLKVANSKPDSEFNMQNEKIIFYEAKVWASDAVTRLLDNKVQAEEFIKTAKAFIKSTQEIVDKIVKNAKKQVKKQNAKKTNKPDAKKLKKQIESIAKLSPNYASSNKAITMMKRFIKRAKLAETCQKNAACYAKHLSDKEPANVEKAVYMIGFLKKMDQYKNELKPAFFNKTPYVREALTIALLKTEDKGFLPILKEELEKDGDKVEFAKSSKEFKAIESYLSSLK